MKTVDILNAAKYYNIAVLLMIPINPFYAVHFYGEKGAFDEWKQANDWANVLRNGNPLNYPIGLNLSREIIRPHYHLTACCLAGVKESSVLWVNEGAPQFGEDWLNTETIGVNGEIKTLSGKQKSEIMEFYSKIPEIYGLNK